MELFIYRPHFRYIFYTADHILIFGNGYRHSKQAACGRSDKMTFFLAQKHSRTVIRSGENAGFFSEGKMYVQIPPAEQAANSSIFIRYYSILEKRKQLYSYITPNVAFTLYHKELFIRPLCKCSGSVYDLRQIIIASPLPICRGSFPFSKATSFRNSFPFGVTRKISALSVLSFWICQVRKSPPLL